MAGHYNITIEFVPDLTEDPDAFRLHRERQYRVEATPGRMKAIRDFENTLPDDDDEEEGGVP